MTDVRFMVKEPEGRIACEFSWRISRGREVTLFFVPMKLRKTSWENKAERRLGIKDPVNMELHSHQPRQPEAVIDEL